MIDTKALKQKILDLAMRGKLVPQNPNDEPVDGLLARIREERSKLEKEKKISKVEESDIYWSDDDNCYYEKKDNKGIRIIDNISHKLPNSWSLISLNSFTHIQTGATFNKDIAITYQQYGYVRVLRGGNIYPFNWTIKSDDLFIPVNQVNDSILLDKGDIITPAVTSLDNVGKFGLIEKKLMNILQQADLFLL